MKRVKIFWVDASRYAERIKKGRVTKERRNVFATHPVLPTSLSLSDCLSFLMRIRLHYSLIPNVQINTSIRVRASTRPFTTAWLIIRWGVKHINRQSIIKRLSLAPLTLQQPIMALPTLDIDYTLYVHKQCDQSIVSASVISHPDVPTRVRNSIVENEKLEPSIMIREQV